MSWSATVSETTKDEVVEDLQEAFDKNMLNASSDVVSQFEKAAGVAKQLIEEKAISGDKFRVQCYGHVKEGDNSSNDAVTVSVSTV